MAIKKTKQTGKAVVIRAYSGVFFGFEVGRRKGEGSDSVDLVDQRQIWQWTSNGLAQKALTVGDIAIRGVGSGSKLSSAGPSATIADVKATFECTPEALKVLRDFPV